jgi:NTE family protein
MGTSHPSTSRTTAFVLSGGGSLGAVQVGMMQALHAKEIRPDVLVGTSVGAVNAAYVAGHGFSARSLDELAAVWTDLRREDVFPIRPRRALYAVGGFAPSLLSDKGLRHVLATHLTFTALEGAAIPLRTVATDLVSGRGLTIGHGDAESAVLASAAIPGLFPPVLREGRTLVDGGLADHAEVLAAVADEVDDIYVLPAGFPCALPVPPRSALGVATHALSILVQQRLVSAVEHYAGPAAIHVIPGLCPLKVSAVDFSHSADLIARARFEAQGWLESGGADIEEPARYLSMHDHAAAPDRRAAAVRAHSHLTA